MAKERRTFLIFMLAAWSVLLGSLIMLDHYDSKAAPLWQSFLIFGLLVVAVVLAVFMIVFLVRYQKRLKQNNDHNQEVLKQYSRAVKVCHSCQHHNDADTKFCQSCGAELTDDDLTYGSDKVQKTTLLHVQEVKTIASLKNYVKGLYLAQAEEMISLGVFDFVFVSALVYMIIEHHLFTADCHVILNVLFIVLGVLMLMANLLVFLSPIITYNSAKKYQASGTTYVYEDCLISNNHMKKNGQSFTITYMLPLQLLMKAKVEDGMMYLIFPQNKKKLVEFYRHEDNDEAWDYLKKYIDENKHK